MATLINGKKIAEAINDETVTQVLKLPRRPSLAIILVGDNPSSKLYVEKKLQVGRAVGIDTHLYKCPLNAGQAEILDIIDWLNADDDIDGIMVQLPLPDGQDYDTDKIVAHISPDKDVDGFQPENINRLVRGEFSNRPLPPVYGVVLTMLKKIDYDFSGKQVVIISKSDIFGGNMARWLATLGAKASWIKPENHDLAAKSRQADILISAVGQAGLINGKLVKEDAVIIDIGISRESGKVRGDVDYDGVKDIAGYISPVPGGVGPVTVSLTLRNTMELCKQRLNK